MRLDKLTNIYLSTTFRKVSLKMNARFLASEVKPIPSALLDIKHPMTIRNPKPFRNSERDKALKPPDILPDQFFDKEGNRIWSKMPSGAHQCELCGFKAVTKNKYREKQDHMAKWHYSKRLELIIPQNTKKPFLCPDCHYTGKDRQCVMRHYTGKHNVLDIWTNEFLRAINNNALTPSMMYMIENVDFNAKRGSLGEKIEQVRFVQPMPMTLPEAETFKSILCKDEPSFESRKSLAHHVELAHAHSRVSTNEILKKTVGLSSTEAVNNPPKSSKKRNLVNTPNALIKKVRVETVTNNKKLELQEIKDSGLVCVTCSHSSHTDDEDDTNLIQSITELQSHILSYHTDLIVDESFVLIQNTAAGPGNHTFTYYLCTQCGKCFSRTSPGEKLRDHLMTECQSTNNNEVEPVTTVSVDHVKSDIIASIQNNNETLAKLLKEISPSVTIIPRPAVSHQSVTALNLTLNTLKQNKRRDPCPCEFCINPNFYDVKLHKCYVEPTCGKTFSKVTHLKAHVRSHNNERPYECEWRGCGKTFVRSDELKRHAWIHTKEDR